MTSVIYHVRRLGRTRYYFQKPTLSAPHLVSTASLKVPSARCIAHLPRAPTDRSHAPAAPAARSIAHNPRLPRAPTDRRRHVKQPGRIAVMRSARLLLSAAGTSLARVGGGLIDQAGPPTTQQAARCAAPVLQCLQPLTAQLAWPQQQQPTRKALGGCLQQQQRQWCGALSLGWTPRRDCQQPRASSSCGGTAWPAQQHRAFHAAAYHASRNTGASAQLACISISCCTRAVTAQGSCSQVHACSACAPASLHHQRGLHCHAFFAHASSCVACAHRHFTPCAVSPS